MITFTKIIYDVKNKSKKQISDILNLEVRTLMNKNPTYPFGKYKLERNNSDGSTTYKITLSPDGF